ncbi:unnamed protein product [Adineta steineri]|uniref:PHD-type domain-containing protein n=1 Tax=Adineta steineri TaxID=433720 RepID=A0A814E2B5_9BILA|nr:unnamed protein product [Adineta steineri]
MASATNNQMEADADYIPPVKLRKTTNEDDHNDLYCFECHDEGDVICCDSCPRVYHPKCLSLTTLPDGDWTCPECKITQSPFNITNHSMNEFHTMLKYAVQHKKSRVIQPIPSTQSSTPSSSTMSTKSFLISPPANTHHHHHKTKTPIPPLTTTSSSHFPAMIPNSNNTFAPRTSSTASQKPNWPTPPLPMSSSTRQPPNTAHKRPAPPLYPPTAQRNSNNNNPSKTRITPPTSLQPQSFDVFSVNTPVQRRPNGIPHPSLPSNTPPLPNRNPVRMPQFNNHLIRPPIEDIQTPGEIQIIIKSFNDKFQQLLTDFTVKIETALESNRVKYEKELEETRRTYRMSMNELRTITTQQVQEMHNSLELQYWTRLSEMRNRYESTLQQHTKPSKQMNGGPLLFFRYLLTIFLV